MEQKKTIREWLKELPDEHRTKAQVNYETRMMELPEPETELMYSSLSSAVKCAFQWYNSPEGFDYWEKVFNELEG